MKSASRSQKLIRAAERGDAATVATLLDEGVSANPPGGEWGALRVAAYHGRTAVVRLLLQRGEDPADVLITTANMGRVEAVRELLAAGADVNAADENGWTALHYAVKPDGPFNQGHLRVVRMLLRAGANPNAPDTSGRSPLFFVMNADHQVIEALIHAGADVNARDQGGWTPLIYASLQGHTANVLNLVTHYGGELHARDCTGKTALGYAARTATWNTVWLVERLLDMGLKPTVEDRHALLREMERLRLEVEALLDRETEP